MWVLAKIPCENSLKDDWLVGRKGNSPIATHFLCYNAGKSCLAKTNPEKQTKPTEKQCKPRKPRKN
jgi:hypothetical protein